MPDTRYRMPDARHERDGEEEQVGYRDLEIWQMARDLSVKIHRMTLEKLPKFEMYEEGTQIRRLSKSVRSNIVEGYGRRRYKQDFIRFIVTAEASCDETTDHLETLFETRSLTDQALYDELHQQLRVLGRKINQFLAAVEVQHHSVKEDAADYGHTDEA